MGPNSLAYRLSLVLAGLNLLSLVVSMAGISAIRRITGTMAAADRLQIDAVVLLEAFLLLMFVTISGFIAMYVRRGRRRDPAAARQRLGAAIG